MSWSVEHDDVLNIVVSTYAGKCTGRDFREAVAARSAMAGKLGLNKALIDAGKLEVSAAATFDLYDIAGHYNHGANFQCTRKIAITRPDSAESRKVVDFYETACLNRGLDVKVFEERNSAVEWLLEEY